MSRTRIRGHELGLRFRDDELVAVLEPGSYTLWSARDRVDVVNTEEVRFTHEHADRLLENPLLGSFLTIVALGDQERALIWSDGRLAEVIGPGKHGFFNVPEPVVVERFDVSSVQLEHELIEVILRHPSAQDFLDSADVNFGHTGLLFCNGKLDARLEPGRVAYWRHAGHINLVCVEMRERSIDITGQEMLTADKVALRVNLLVVFRVVDPQVATCEISNYESALYREAQLALRGAVGSRTIDELLSDKAATSSAILTEIAPSARSFGVEVLRVGLRDIILPGEMRAILNEVVLAEKRAQANLIKRREETAAARSQANTARLLAENPTLARIKELELLADVLDGARATFVFGDGSFPEHLRVFSKSTSQKEIENPGS